MGSPHTLGVIGLGVISGVYLDTLANHPDVRIAAFADRSPERATEAANILHPEDPLYVPKTTWPLLEVWFDHVDRALFALDRFTKKAQLRAGERLGMSAAEAAHAPDLKLLVELFAAA